MSVREELIRAGIPEQANAKGELGVDRVERNIVMAHPARVAVRAEGDTVVFETVVGKPRSVEIEARRLWDPTMGKPLTSGELKRELAPLRQAGDDVSDEEVEQARARGRDTRTDLETLGSIILLESIKGFGPQKFRDFYEAGLSPREVAERPELLPTRGKRGDSFRAELARLTVEDKDLALRRAARQIVRACEHEAYILTLDDPLYPRNVRESNTPVPILYVRGALDVLGNEQAVACVGSRGIRPPYDHLHALFADTAVAEGFTVVSGFALGADVIGHRAAVEAGGRTIAVMPSGLDRPFPPENREVWDQFLAYRGAAFVSEFPFGTAAASLTLRKRNKLIVAFAKGVLVSQSSVTGGAMNAYRFALEQRKPVVTFAADGESDSTGNEFITKEAQTKQTRLAELSCWLPAQPDPSRWHLWLRELSSSI
jgi:DNA protecting protein DprA